MTKPTRQLPGVKGQWILAADCPPTEADGDENGHVRVASPDVKDWWGYVHWSDVRTDRYWIPEFNYFNKDSRPLVLPAAPAPEQTASTERLFVQIVRSDRHVYAVADDGTAWVRHASEVDWSQIEPLPSRDT